MHLLLSRFSPLGAINCRLVVSGLGLLSLFSYSWARISEAGVCDSAKGAGDGYCIEDEASNTEAAITRAVRKYIHFSHFLDVLLDNNNFRLATEKKFNSLIVPKSSILS